MKDPLSAVELYEKLERERTENDQLKQRLEEAERVIGFYGDVENWNGDNDGMAVDDDHESFRVSDNEMTNYAGKRAREYLEKYKQLNDTK